MARPGRDANETRERIVTAAERLFAEQGTAVSSRLIGAAAGQSNNSAVGYQIE